MLGKPGPFQIIENDGIGCVDLPISAPRRRHSCQNYQSCLDLACALNWDSFTCRGCSGSIDQSLLWQGHQAKRKDSVAKRLCDIPEIQYLSSEEHQPVVVNFARKTQA